MRAAQVKPLRFARGQACKARSSASNSRGHRKNSGAARPIRPAPNRDPIHAAIRTFAGAEVRRLRTEIKPKAFSFSGGKITLRA
jgi:hypothetical protein